MRRTATNLRSMRTRTRRAVGVSSGSPRWRLFGGLLFGYDSAVINGAVSAIGHPRQARFAATARDRLRRLLVDYLLAGLAGGSRGMLWFGLEAWRWMFIAMMVPAVLYGVLALTIPESPRHKCAVGTYRCGPLHQRSVVLADDRPTISVR